MTDEVDFASPCGLLGTGVDRVFLTAYMSRLLRTRNRWLAASLEASHGFAPSS